MNNQSESQPIIEELIAIRSELKKLNQYCNNLEQQKWDKIVKNKSLLIIVFLFLINIGLEIKPEKYEYQVVSPSDYIFDESMNTEGANGWQTVTCRRANDRITDEFGYECIMIRKK